MLGWMLSLSASLRGRATPPEGVVRRFSNNGIERTHESYTDPVSARSPLMRNTLAMHMRQLPSEREVGTLNS